MKIACVLASGFEDSEFKVPCDALRAAGATVDVISFKAGEELAGMHGKVHVESDRGIDEAHEEQYAALLIPGGHSPDRLRADPRFVELTRRFVEAGKLVAAVCHGPQLLVTAEVVRGRTMTAWQTIQVDLRNAGANVVDQEVVRDGQLITSRQPSDLSAFTGEILTYLGLSAPAHPASDAPAG